MAKQTVYLETSIISYLAARKSRDLLAAAWQKVTRGWWDIQRERFDLYISELVVEEAARGHPSAAAKRLEALAGIPVLEITLEVIGLSEALLNAQALPRKAIGDSLHIALSAVHGLDYLLTWNYRHIDNAERKPIVREVCIANGYAYPEICTPQELMGVNDNDR